MSVNKKRVKVAVRTDTGRVRDLNEDHCVIRFSNNCLETPKLLAAVADGMGGGPAGELASRTAIEVLEEHFVSQSEVGNEATQILKTAFEEANRAIHRLSREDEKYNGMGTTLTAAIVDDEVAIIGHVGDSRAYLIRGGSIYQITEDHSLVNEWVKNGEMTQEEARISPQRSIITRSIGTNTDVIPEIYQRELDEGDGILLCTDGLNDLVEDAEILAIILNTKSAEHACTNLLELANLRGGHDNITAISLEIGLLPRDNDIDRHVPTTPIKPKKKARKLLLILLALLLVTLLAAGVYLIDNRLREQKHEPAKEAPAVELVPEEE